MIKMVSMMCIEIYHTQSHGHGRGEPRFHVCAFDFLARGATQPRHNRCNTLESNHHDKETKHVSVQTHKCMGLPRLDVHRGVLCDHHLSHSLLPLSPRDGRG